MEVGLGKACSLLIGYAGWSIPCERDPEITSLPETNLQHPTFNLPHQGGPKVRYRATYPSLARTVTFGRFTRTAMLRHSFAPAAIGRDGE